MAPPARAHRSDGCPTPAALGDLAKPINPQLGLKIYVLGKCHNQVLSTPNPSISNPFISQPQAPNREAAGVTVADEYLYQC